MVKIRLMRMGAKKRPFYRVVVADSRSPRDGRFIENIGKYHPLNHPSVIEIDEDRAIHWLKNGAQATEPVKNLLVKTGIWDKFQGGPGTPVPPPPDEPKPKPKAEEPEPEPPAEDAEPEPEAPAEDAEPPAEPEPEPPATPAEAPAEVEETREEVAEAAAGETEIAEPDAEKPAEGEDEEQ